MLVMNHVMLDIETLDVEKTAYILSVGAAFFVPETGEVGPGFYQVISLDHEQAGRTIAPSTVKWWMYQSSEAKNENFGGTKDLLDVLNEFVAFVLHNRNGRVKVWGNGKEFDCTIMHHALSQAGLECPWSFRDTLDVRTILALGESKGIFSHADKKFTGIRHTAFDDVLFQIALVSHIYMNLNKNKYRT